MAWLWLTTAVIAAILTLAGIALVAVATFRSVSRTLERQLGENPRWTPWEWLFSLNTHSWRELALTMQRAEMGKPATHPMGSRPEVDWLSQVGWDPATLEPTPVAMAQAVDLTTVVGPRAPRPLVLSLPVVVAPMGYGVAVTDDVKVALAQAASLAGTAVASGEGPFVPEERAFAQQWILQTSRAGWSHQRRVVTLADMIEIQMGQGAEASIGVKRQPSTLPDRVRRATHHRAAVIHAAGVRPLDQWVRELRRTAPDVPIGVKIPASQHLEADLSRLVALGVDFITVDGSGAASSGSPAVIADHFGVATAVATARAHRWLHTIGQRRAVSLIVSGGVHGAQDIAKLIALGADAVAVGSELLFALSHEQVWHVLPAHPPTAQVLAHGTRRRTPRLDVDWASEHAARWFHATAEELALICRAVGIRRIHDLGRQHLIARTPEAAWSLELAYDADRFQHAQYQHTLSALVASYQELQKTLRHIWQQLRGHWGEREETG
jgi:tRNA-dihydrouridine synthase